MLDSLTAKMSRLKDQGKIPMRGKGPNDFAPRNPNFVPYRRNNPLAQILQRDRNQAEDQIIRDPFQNVVLEEEQEFAQEEWEEEDNINCMEDEVDLSFLTQANYEEALMNEQIMEESLYQVDDQEGYNLRSRIVAPVKKSPAPTKQPTPPAKKIVAPTKKMVAPPKQQ